jgi:hypothetical protein
MDEMALIELNWTMFELPAPGSRYWHDRSGYTVREVDRTQDPPHVHLVHDRAYEEELHAGLPEGYLLRAVHSARIRGDDFESAAGQALAAAGGHARAQARQA